MSWGRHNWPRKNEMLRIYREKNGTFFLFDPETNEGIANALNGKEPSLTSTGISPSYIYQKGCKRVQWCELPPLWRAAFKPWLTKSPKDYRGFWLVGQQPTKKISSNAVSH